MYVVGAPTPLVVAGGGGGAFTYSSPYNGGAGQITTSGEAGYGPDGGTGGVGGARGRRRF